MRNGGIKVPRKKAKRWVTALIVLAAVLLILFGLYMLMNARTFALFGHVVSKIDTDEKVVYLTFDDGPTQNTQRILDKLDELDVKATFFLIGNCMEENPGFTQEIIQAGHDIGNHSYSHQRMVLKTLSFIKDEVDKTNAIIKRLGYEREIFFRPPYGKKLILLPWYLNETEQTMVMWTMEPETYPEVSKDAESIAQYVIDNVSDGAIILLHPMNDDTDKSLEALELIVESLREKGYRFKILSQE